MLFKILISLFVFVQPQMINVDSIAAVVNDEIITLTDIDKSILLYPTFRLNRQSEQSYYHDILEDLIRYKVVSMEYRNEVSLTAEDFETIQISVIRKLGSLEALMSVLDRFDMEWKDFKDFVEEKVIYEKIIKSKFKMEILIDFIEIEEFYQREYLPMQRKLNLQPKSVIEMTPLIEEHLQKSKREEKLSSWIEELKVSYRIDYKILGS